MEFSTQITVNASAEKVWKIIGTNFNDISEWASFVVTSEANPDLPDGGGRVCNVKGVGEVYETIYQYDDVDRNLAFTLEGGVNPFFMRKIENSWAVEPNGENESVVHMGVNVKMLPVFEQLMKFPLTRVFKKRSSVILNELKYFAENDKAIHQ